MIDQAELRQRWQEKRTVLHQLGRKLGLTKEEARRMEIQEEIAEVIEEEAIELGLGPREVEGVINELIEESLVTDRVEALLDRYGSQPVALEELEEAVKGPQPIKEVKYGESNTEAAADARSADPGLQEKLDALAASFRAHRVEVLGTTVGFITVVGPLGEELIKQRAREELSWSGLGGAALWGLADLCAIWVVKKLRSGVINRLM